MYSSLDENTVDQRLTGTLGATLQYSLVQSSRQLDRTGLPGTMRTDCLFLQRMDSYSSVGHNLTDFLQPPDTDN